MREREERGRRMQQSRESRRAVEVQGVEGKACELWSSSLIARFRTSTHSQRGP